MITLTPYSPYTLEESHIHELEKLIGAKFKNLNDFFEDWDGEGGLLSLLHRTMHRI